MEPGAHALEHQRTVGEARVGHVVDLGRRPGAAAVAAVGHHVDAPALVHEAGDARGTDGQAAAVAVEVEQRRLAGLGLAVPGDDALAVGRSQHALIDVDQAHLSRLHARRVGEVHELALGEIGGDQDEGVGGRGAEGELDPKGHSRLVSCVAGMVKGAIASAGGNRLPIAVLRARNLCRLLWHVSYILFVSANPAR